MIFYISTEAVACFNRKDWPVIGIEDLGTSW